MQHWDEPLDDQEKAILEEPEDDDGATWNIAFTVQGLPDSYVEDIVKDLMIRVQGEGGYFGLDRKEKML